jgi:N-acetylmuramoyl-L-alanine amidase
MHTRRLAALLAVLGLLSVPARPARAEVPASGTRVAIGEGAPRFYMTYGHVEESELYAPISAPLQRLGVVLRRRGEDYEVLLDGRRRATWPIVTRRQAVPETGEHPCVLVMGGNVFVPVRAVSRLLRGRVGWSEAENLVTLQPPRPSASEPARPPSSAPEAAPALLSAVEVTAAGRGVRVRVHASRTVEPSWVALQHLNPPRIALDFRNARWADSIRLPGGVGAVSGVRTGSPEPGTARLVLELRSATVRLTALEVRGDGVVASVGSGPSIARAQVDSEVARALERRRRGWSLRASRGGLRLDEPRSERLLPPLDLEPAPVRPGRFRAQPAATLAGRTICLDPGHGGHDPGSLGRQSRESVLCLKMALELKRELAELGATVVMTRTREVGMEEAERLARANASGADCLISLHCNSMPRPNMASGTETYYYTAQSARLAAALHPRVVGVVSGRDGGIRNYRRLYMVRRTVMPSVLLEIAFIDHRQDEALLRGPSFASELARSLAQGLLDYFGTDVD